MASTHPTPAENPTQAEVFNTLPNEGIHFYTTELAEVDVFQGQNSWET